MSERLNARRLGEKVLDRVSLDSCYMATKIWHVDWMTKELRAPAHAPINKKTMATVFPPDFGE